MAVVETLQGLGSWGLQLKPNTPDHVWRRINYYGHVVVHVGRSIDPRVSSDSLLKSSRYTGVLRAIGENNDQRSIGGLGMAMWLGDPDNKSDIVEELLEVNGPFHEVIAEILTGFDAVVPGTIFNIGENFASGFQFQSRREIIQYITQTVGAAWRVNGDATLDAGLESDLFVTDPKMLVVRKKNNAKNTASMDDMFLRALAGQMETASDMEDFSTRVLLMAQGTNGQFASATADIDPGLNPFLDLHGNPIKMTRIVQESQTDPDNAEARAQLQLNRFSSSRDALTLSSVNYDIKGDAQVGDYIGVFDPAMKLQDVNNEEIFRGERINPLNLQLTEISWPVTKDMSVFYRGYDGGWLDLTDYFIPENGDTTLVVGGYNRSLSDSEGGGAFPVIPPDVNTTIPGQVEWDLPLVQMTYQSPVTGETRAEVELRWFQPDNTDLSNMTDGDHYEIRYRHATTPLGPTTHNMMSAFTHAELAVDGTFGQPIRYPETEWNYAYAPWSVLRFRLQELLPSMPYEVQIRALDNGTPANVGEWSELIEFQTINDNIPPAVPAAPEVASNLLSVQVVHRLGAAAGGLYNLDRDLHHLEVHGGTEPLFHPSEETLLGKMIAHWGMITGNIPAVATFQIRGLPRPPDPDPGATQPTDTLPAYFKVMAVDTAGNKSLASPAAESSAELISSQYVSDLTVSKLTAGRMTAEVLVASRITTAEDGPRVQLSHAGIQGYKTDNTLGLDWKSENGLLHVLGEAGIKVTGGGNVEITDGAVVVKNASGNVIVELGECADGRHGLQVYKDNGARVARIGELASAGGEGIEFVNDLGQLVRANTLAFGQQAADIQPFVAVTTIAPAWGNFGGPQVTVDIGTSGRALVFLSGWANADDAAYIQQTFQAVYVPTGAVSYAAGLRLVTATSTFASGINDTYSGAFLVTGLAAGQHTFRCWYRTNLNNGSGISDRTIIVLPY